MSSILLLAQTSKPLMMIFTKMCNVHHHHRKHDPSERQGGQEAFQEFCQCNACDANVRLPARILRRNHKERESGRIALTRSNH